MNNQNNMVEQDAAEQESNAALAQNSAQGKLTSAGQNLDPDYDPQYDEDGNEIPPEDADFVDFLSAIGSDGEGNDDSQADMTPEQRQQQAQQMTQNLGNELRSAIGAATLPQELFPEDFDPSDRNQMQQLLTGVYRHALANAVQLTLRPVNVAMNTQRDELRREMSRHMNGTISKEREAQRLATEFPLINHPTYGVMFRKIDENLTANKQSVDQRIKSLRALAKRLGVQTEPAAAGRGTQGAAAGRGPLVGRSALDELFGSLG